MLSEMEEEEEKERSTSISSFVRYLWKCILRVAEKFYGCLV
jgi:hypothetical protein